MEVEILNTSQGQAVYVNASSVELEAEGKTAEGYSTIKITLIVQNQTHDFSGFLLQGGHRVLLPEDASHLMIHALCNNQEITLSIGIYSTILIPNNFIKHYQSL
ncbi:MAG: hypothetical protein HWD61_14990 [Parachlamydiaceae bacterium]|nr:MAG: hypothetical protein HWD61_14990 [Parachlamydiaceae bacterium]